MEELKEASSACKPCLYRRALHGLLRQSGQNIWSGKGQKRKITDVSVMWTELSGECGARTCVRANRGRHLKIEGVVSTNRDVALREEG
jgi:hypothetical protein